VYMIFYAVNTIKFTILVFYYTGNILIQFSAICFINCRVSILGAENDLVKDLTISTHKFF
jgi:hypothetical protein